MPIWRRIWPSRNSIAARFFLSAAGSCLAILLIAGIALTTVYRRAAERGFDERLGVYIKELIADLAAPAEGERDTIGDLGEPRFLLPLSGWYWQIVRTDAAKAEMRASRSLVGSQLPRLADSDIPVGRLGLRVTYHDGPDDRRLRLAERFVDVGEDGQFFIAVAGPANDIDEDIRDFRNALALTFALLAAALVGSAALAVRFGLKPLNQLRSSIEAIRTGQAQQIEGSYPPDIAPLAGELNLLIINNHEILERARTQVGNLAHALKTPLSVMVNEADASRGALAAKVREQTAVMRDQLQYYLDRARAAAVSGILGGVTEVSPSIDALIRTFDKIYAGRFIDADNQVPERVIFRGEKQDFEEMVGNLLDNAFKWAKSEVVVSCERIDDSATPQIIIHVDNDGPPLTPEAAVEALRRGRRLDESKPGSGLGLSIVVDMAKLYGGTLKLENAPSGGVRARLALPTV
jgi:signal transduction histidine kinase